MKNDLGVDQFHELIVEFDFFVYLIFLCCHELKPLEEDLHLKISKTLVLDCIGEGNIMAGFQNLKV